MMSYKLSFPRSSVLKVSLIVPSVACLGRGVSGIGNFFVARKRRSRVNTVPCILGRVGMPVCTAGLAVKVVSEGLRRRNVLGAIGEGIMGCKRRVGLNYFEIRFVGAGRDVRSTTTLTVCSPTNVIIRANSFGISCAPMFKSTVSLTEFNRVKGGNILTLVYSDAGTREPNFARSRGSIKGMLSNVFRSREGGEVVVTAFTSGMSHIRRVVGYTRGCNEGITVRKQDVMGVVSVTSRLNCLSLPSGVLVSMRRLEDCPSRRAIVVAAKDRKRSVTTLSHVTGNAREGMSVGPGSAVMFDSGPVPKGRGSIANVVGRLVVGNTSIVFRSIRISNRTYRRSVGLVCSLIGPGCTVPIRKRCGRLITRTGVTRRLKCSASRVGVLSSKSILRVGRSNTGIANEIRINGIVISKLNMKSMKGVILHSERHLTRSKVVVIIVALRTNSNRLLTNPSVMSEKFMCIHGSRDLVSRTGYILSSAVRHLASGGIAS